MTEQIDYTEMNYQYYPTRSRFQRPTTIKVNAMIPIDTREDFLPADQRAERDKELADTLITKIKYIIERIKEDGLWEDSCLGSEDLNNSIKTPHQETLPHSSGSPLPPLQVPSESSNTKEIKVFDFHDSHICPFCWEDGYTIKTRDGDTKYIPQGGHNKVGEKDLMYSAKYGRPVAMCYHHQQLFYKDESAKSKMIEQLMVIDKEIENNPASDYHIRTINVEVKV